MTMNISISKFLNLARWLTRPKAQVPGFDQVIGSPESILIFLKNQNDVVLVKKKQKSTGCNRVFDQVFPGQLGHAGF
jgi:hypothetical protein